MKKVLTTLSLMTNLCKITMAKDCVSKFECATRIKWSSCSITWTINEISKLVVFNYSKEDPLLSKTFSTDSNHVWQLQLYMTRSSNLEIHCNAVLISGGILNITINCSISFLDIEKKELITEKTSHYSRKCDVNEQQLFQSLIKDQLTIFCEINVGIEQTEPLCPTPVWDESYLHRSLNQKFEKFQGNQFLTDVDLEVSGKTFKGHKLILAAVSPVFEKMFQGNSHEHQNNRVIIEDVDADVFEELMTYIYSGQLPHLKEMVSDLLAVADKYSILPLLEICMTDLLKNMSVDDAAATYVLADRHSLHQVKPTIIHFMKKHFYDVATSAGWISLVTHHPQLTKEIRDKLREKTV